MHISGVSRLTSGLKEANTLGAVLPKIDECPGGMVTWAGPTGEERVQLGRQTYLSELEMREEGER